MEEKRQVIRSSLQSSYRHKKSKHLYRQYYLELVLSAWHVGARNYRVSYLHGDSSRSLVYRTHVATGALSVGERLYRRDDDLSVLPPSFCLDSPLGLQDALGFEPHPDGSPNLLTLGDAPLGLERREPLG